MGETQVGDEVVVIVGDADDTVLVAEGERVRA